MCPKDCAKDCAYIVEHLSVRFMELVADHSRQLAEHRAAFGARTEADAKIIAGLRAEIGASRMAVPERDSLMSERNGLLTQVQDMRAEINRLQGENATMHQDAEDGYAEAIKVLGDPIALSKERDALRAEVDFLKTLRPKYKVGDKLESYNRLLGLAIPVTIVGVRTVYDCQADGAEYPVGHSEDELTERYEQTPPEATHAEPDLTQLHAKGKEAWSDVPNATQWVEEMRGNSEATHDTEAGKAAAEAALETESVAEEIKVGDVVEVFQKTGICTFETDIGTRGTVEQLDDSCVATAPLDGYLSPKGNHVALCDVRKVTT